MPGSRGERVGEGSHWVSDSRCECQAGDSAAGVDDDEDRGREGVLDPCTLDPFTARAGDLAPCTLDPVTGRAGDLAPCTLNLGPFHRAGGGSFILHLVSCIRVGGGCYTPLPTLYTATQEALDDPLCSYAMKEISR